MAPVKRARVPQDALKGLMNDMFQDPQLPRPNPTEAFWQLPASAIAHHQSAQLPERTTYAIIGSGITGCSVSRNLLQNLPADSNATVTVLEARALTSGATGRNGGHLLSPIPDIFCDMEKHFGREETVKIAKFADRTLDSMYKLGNDGDLELVKAAEIRKVKAVTGIYDQEVFEAMTKSHKRYEELVPECKGDLEVHTPEEGKEKFNMNSTAGVLTHGAGAFWPYRLITLLFAQMLEEYKDQFSIETETPVSAVEFDSQNSDYPYLLTTPRGKLRATKVIYCTNGWTGYLLPQLRGKIFPLRGTVSCQQPGSALPNEGNNRSWSTLDRTIYDPEDHTISYGLYYITQNAVTGDIFVGGEKEKLSQLLTSDDTQIGEMSMSKLEAVLPSIFATGWAKDEKPVVRKTWSGIMGFTPDHLPLVGQIPNSITGRKGDGEWIAAGYNGYGMPLCWGCGEAVAKSILGKKAEVDAWLPESFLVTTKRLNGSYMTPEAAAAVMLEQEPGLMTTARLAVRHVLGAVQRAIFG